MSALLVLALVAQSLSPPVLREGNVRPAFDATMNSGGVAATRVRLVVSADGSPVHCTVRFSNGPSTNGERLCDQLREEARFSPAMDGQGRPTAGVIDVWSHWKDGRWLGSEPPSWDPIDLALTVNRMPQGFAEMETLHLLLLVDPAGKVAQCEVSASGLPSAVTTLLCKEAAVDTIPPAANQQGTPVVSVQPFRVRLTSSAFQDALMRRIQRQ